MVVNIRHAVFLILATVGYISEVKIPNAPSMSHVTKYRRGTRNKSTLTLSKENFGMCLNFDGA